MVITGPYYVEKPRYSGEHHAVTVRRGASVITRGFTAEPAAEAFAGLLRANGGRVPADVQGELITPTILVTA